MERLDEGGLKALLDDEITSALGYVGKLSEQRRKALYYYFAEAKEDLSPPEVDGRSSAVSTDLSDVVEWIMPSLIEMFAGGDEAVQFMPRKGSDEDAAKQMTALCNAIWEKNSGFKVYHTWFKDALLEKAGVVKIWWDAREIKTRESYRGLTDMQLGMLLQQEGVEPIEHSAYPMPMQPGMPMPMQPMQPGEQPPVPQLHDVTIIVTKPRNEICIENIPPEEFLISRRAKDVEKAPFICHRTPKTASELREMGIEQSVIDRLSTDDHWGEYNAERVERVVKDDESPWTSPASQDASQRVFWVAECYVRVDWDGDGIAELRKITKVGSEILDNEEIDAMPFAAITPIMMSHRFFGRSIYDILAPIMRIKTAVLRGALDSIYLATNARHYAVEGQVNLDDLLASRPGGVVRVKSPDAVGALTSPPVHEGAFAALQYLDDWRENISGVTKYNQGTDANSLNKTLGGINAIMQASNQRIKLIGRVFAETGVRDAFLQIQKLLLQYQKQGMTVRINGKFVDVDPRTWANEYDMTVATGLGSGSKDQAVAHIMGITQMQQGLIQAGMVQPKALLHSGSKMVEAMGYKDVENWLPTYNPQSPNPADHPPPQQPPLELMVEQAKGQTVLQKAQMDGQVVMQQSQAEAALAAQERDHKAQLDQSKLIMEQQAKEQDALRQIELEKWKASLKAETDMAIAQMRESLINERELQLGMRHAEIAARPAVQLGGSDVTSALNDHMQKNGQANQTQSDAIAQALAMVAEGLKGLNTTKRAMKMPDGSWVSGPAH